MGAGLLLLQADRDQAIPVVGEEIFAEEFAAVRIGAFADEEGRGFLAQGHAAEERCHSGGRLRLARSRLGRCQFLSQQADETGMGAAAAADELDTFFTHHLAEMAHKLIGGEGIDHLAGHILRQSGIGLAEHRAGELLADLLDKGPHRLGAGGAVQAKDVDLIGREGGEHGADLRAHQKRSGGLHSHRDRERQINGELGHGIARGKQGGFDLEQVLAGFDYQEVCAALDEPECLLEIGAVQGRKVGLAEGNEFRARPHGAGDESRFASGGRRGAAGESCCSAVDLARLFLESIFAQDDAVGAEGVGLDHIGAGGVITGMYALDFIRRREVEDFIAARFTSPLRIADVEILYLRPHGPVKYDHLRLLQSRTKIHAYNLTFRCVMPDHEMYANNTKN